MEKQWKEWQTLKKGFIFLGSKITADGDCSHEIKRCLLLGRKAMANLDSVFKSKDNWNFVDKDLYSQSYGFSTSHVWMWELNHKEGWALNKYDAFELWLEKTLENPFDSKEIKPVSPKGNQPWIFTGRTDIEGEAPILWPLNEKSWLIGKDSNARPQG